MDFSKSEWGEECRLKTSAMCPLTSSGYVAMMTRVIRQFKMKAMMKEVTTREKFCNRMVDRSTTIVFSSVASASKRDDNMELLLFISSKNPISFLKIAGIR